MLHRVAKALALASLLAVAACGGNEGAENPATTANRVDEWPDEGPITINLPGATRLLLGSAGLSGGAMDIIASVAPTEGGRSVEAVAVLESATLSSELVDPPEVDGCRGLVPKGITPALDPGASWVYFGCFDWAPEERQLALLGPGGSWDLVGERFSVPGATGSSLTTTLVGGDEMVIASGGAGVCAVDLSGAADCVTWPDLGGQCAQITRPRLVGGEDEVFFLVGEAGSTSVISATVTAAGHWECGQSRPIDGAVQAYVGPRGLLLRVDGRTVQIELAKDGTVLATLPSGPDETDLWTLGADPDRAVACSGIADAVTLDCAAYALS